MARVVTLADLGDYLDANTDDLWAGLPQEFHGDPAHAEHCPYAPPRG